MLLVCILTASLAVASVPTGGCVLLNGLLGAGEWLHSASVSLEPETDLLYHQDDESLFLAIAFLGPKHTGVDLYLDSKGSTRMIHISTALGERVLTDGQWSDFTWGENSWWSGNTIGTIYEDGRPRFLEPEAFEFQIDRSELGESVQLLIHLKRPEKLLPSGATEEEHEKWLILNLQ